MHIIGRWSPAGVLDDSEYTYSHNHLGLKLSEHVTVVEDKSVYLVYQGTIFDRSQAELLRNRDALNNAFGLYSYVRISKDSGEITIGTDKLGFSPIYFARQSEGLTFSTSLTLLKGHLPVTNPDFEAWDEILNLGDLLGSKTTIKEIERLEPGTRIVIEDNKYRFQTFWEPEMPGQSEHRDYIERNNELLMEAMELSRNSEIEKTILMSGGHDSRRLGITAKHIGLPVRFATQETQIWRLGKEDSSIAQQVADALSIPLYVEPVATKETAYIDSVISDFWFGWESGQHQWILPLLRSLPEGSMIYDGIVGDIITNGHFLRAIPELMPIIEDVDKVARLLTTRSVLAGFASRYIDSTLFDRVRQQLLQYPDCSQRVNYYFVMNHTRRDIGLQLELYSLFGHKTCCPYTYYPLFKQSFEMNPYDQFKYYYHKECMSALNRKVSEIPSTRECREELPSAALLREQDERNRLFAKKVVLRGELKEFFPSSRNRLRIHDIAELLHLTPLKVKMFWRTAPLVRLSRFLDWLEDDSPVNFPVEADQPRFIVRQVGNL